MAIQGMTITPKFNATELVNEVIQKEWFVFQNEALLLGRQMHEFMRRYINNNRHRTGGTNKLANSINFEILSTSMGRLEWGIGNINQLVPYWHVIATGKMISGGRFRPGGGKYRPVRFTDGNADPKNRIGYFTFESPTGGGTARATSFSPIGGGRLPSYVRPIPYIEVTRAHLDYEIEKLLARLGSM